MPGEPIRERASFFVSRVGVSVVVPFLIITIVLGILSYRSYQLAARTEVGIQAFAAEYLHSAAEISARRIDAAVQSKMFKATEEWQQIERRTGSLTTSDLSRWMEHNPWIVSAIYVPDDDPLGSVYVSEARHDDAKGNPRYTHEFYTASGSVRYGYDPLLLLGDVKNLLTQSVDPHSSALAETAEVRRASRLDVVNLQQEPQDTALDATIPLITVPLADPLGDFAVRASIHDAYIGVGWENQRVVSLWLAVISIVIVVIAAFMTSRGLRREAETIRLRSALIANVSHELRTPLSMIRLGTETLMRGSRLRDDQREEIAQSIHRESMHLSHLVENVLDVARMEKSGVKLVRGPVNPGELVTSLVTSYRSWLESKGFTVELSIDDRIQDQIWDREAMSRVLLNLIDNAVKYSSDDKRIEIGVIDHPDRVEVAVHDHGIGLDASDLPRIFEPYYRAQFSDTQTRRGAGLGLTLVRQIIRAHGGRIEASSTPGSGSTFRITIPKDGDDRGTIRREQRHSDAALEEQAGESQ